MPRVKGSKNNKSLNERFMEKIVVDEKTGCWNYGTGNKNTRVYIDNGKYADARHAAWFLHYGKFTSGIIDVSCKNFWCVNTEHFILTTSWEDRFWRRVNKLSDNDCWEWTGHKDTKGYGILSHSYSTKAHRLSWLIHYGDIPVGMCVCHHCDNTSCVNPKHLFLGTIKDNNLDKKQKGRQHGAIGERNFGAILKESQVKAIRFLYKSGEFSTYSLADVFQVSRNCISKIINNKTWSHIK